MYQILQFQKLMRAIICLYISKKKPGSKELSISKNRKTLVDERFYYLAIDLKSLKEIKK